MNIVTIIEASNQESEKDIELLVDKYTNCFVSRGNDKLDVRAYNLTAVDRALQQILVDCHGDSEVDINEIRETIGNYLTDIGLYCSATYHKLLVGTNVDYFFKSKIKITPFEFEPKMIVSMISSPMTWDGNVVEK